MNVNRLLGRTAAVVLPTALVLGATGTALAAKPVRPQPVLDTKPAASSNVVSPTFGWHVDTTKLSVGSSMNFTCALDGKTAVACGTGTVDAAHSPVLGSKSYTGLANGAHSFVVKGYSGTTSNGKPSAASYQWTIDTVAPLAPSVSPITSPTSNTTAAVSFSDADASVTGFTCALDGGTAVACTSPHTYTDLLEGGHSVVVTARDAAGNTSTGSVSWTVDHTAPNIPAVAGPTSPTNNPDASVTFSGAVGDTFTCSLDGALATDCTSPWTATGLAEGSHTLTVTPYDAAHNAGTPGTATWVVDVTPPAVPSLVSAPASPTNDGAFTVRFAAGDLTTSGFLCAFEGGVATPCTSPWSVDPALVLSNTTYDLAVVALDAAGNTSTVLPVSWVYDTAAPSPASLVNGPSTPSNVLNPTFDFVDTDNTTDHFTCSFDGGAVLDPCAPGVSLSAVLGRVLKNDGTEDGPHGLAVRAVDNAHNASAPVVWNWTLDTTAPVSQPNTSGGVPAGNQGPVTSTPTFVFASNDPAVVGFVCQLVPGTATWTANAWTPCSSGYKPSVADGTWTLWVATIDQAGNVGTPIKYTWTLDTVAPKGTIVFPTTLAGAVRVNFAEPVLGITTSTVRLGVTGTTSFVPTTLTCRNASNATVSCASAGGVRAAVLAHASRLMAGQKYYVKVTGAVHDLAGNPGSAPTTAYRAQRLLQENEAAIGQAWTTRTTTAAYGGRYVHGHLANDAASFAFRGTSITWYTVTGPSMGSANVYCGSTYKGRVNNYATSNHYRVARTVKCSSTTANNVLKIVATGLKGSTKGTGTYVVVDAVKVGSTLTTNPALTMRWGTAASSLALGGRYAVADRAGEAFSLTFRGTAITWRTLFGKNMGKAKVYIDGVYKGSYDQFATTSKAVNRTWKLADKVHTIKVVVSGTRRTGATGTRVVLDSLTVG